MVWRIPVQQSPGETGGEKLAETRPTLRSSSSGRPMFRTTTGGRALEVDLSKEPTDQADAGQKGEHELVADLTEHGQRFVLCKSGRGGLGNRNFATATHQTPRFAQPGEPGEECDFLLELRIIARVAL